MKIPMVMSPGPTQVAESVRLSRGMETTNPDLDIQFFEFYKETCQRFAEFLKTKNDVRILCGEGILGLEAACASLTEPGDRVLVISNGVFGEGFGDFVRIYGGEPVYFRGDTKEDIDIIKLKEFLDNDSDFKYATIVHCDTPSGVLNNIENICPLLKEKGILTVVDSVAAMGGEEIKVDEWKIDIALGGSQKCLSAPPGLTIVSISDDAYGAMENRKVPISSFYCNLLIWKNYYKNKEFPYTQPISDILALRKAVDNIIEDKEILLRHEILAKGVRMSVIKAGLNLYTYKGYSNTVTAIELPENINSQLLRDTMIKEFNVLIGGSVGFLSKTVVRIGHMGENARKDKISYTLMALQKCLEKQNFQCKCNMAEEFIELVN